MSTGITEVLRREDITGACADNEGRVRETLSCPLMRDSLLNDHLTLVRGRLYVVISADRDNVVPTGIFVCPVGLTTMGATEIEKISTS